MPLSDQQQTELTRSLHRSHGSFELAAAPVLMALIGLGLDRWLGTAPVLTIVLAVMGVLGSTIKVVYTYRADMASATAERPVSSSKVDVGIEGGTVR